MTNEEYIQNVLRTESPKFKSQNERLMHGICGCVTEAGEMMDNFKRATFYRDGLLDENNLIEEMGDMLWYLAVMCDTLGCTFEALMELNIQKLRIRYPDKEFQTESALNRDLEKERKVFDETA
jgi:NTP pyrophosphatase (non-canonical NTP hydrolase)